MQDWHIIDSLQASRAVYAVNCISLAVSTPRGWRKPIHDASKKDLHDLGAGNSWRMVVMARSATELGFSKAKNKSKDFRKTCHTRALEMN